MYLKKRILVCVDANLTCEEHMVTKVKKANQIVGLIRRSFTYLDEKSFVKLYTALVRPHLKYAQCVWSPHLKKHQDTPRVQERATKLVDHMNDIDYSERHKILNLPTLSFQRFRGDMIEMYKHFRNYDRTIISKSLQPKDRESRRHKYQLHERAAKDRSRGVQHNSFYHLAAREWTQRR